MFEGVFRKNRQSKKDPSKEELFDQLLLRVVAWKEQQNITNDLMTFADMVLWADKSSPSCLELVKTHLVLKTFTQIYSTNEDMAIAVIQPLVLILTNLKSEEFLKYVLGEEVMSVIFARIPTDFEAVSYYVSLMKTISQRINVDNVQQIVAEDGGCPLLERCVELYSTEDSLAQTTVLHIILTFMREKYVLLTPLFRTNSFKSFYLQLSTEMIELFRRMDEVVLTLRQETMGRLAGMLEEVQDLFLFFVDISKIEDPEINHIVGTIIHKCILLPIILSSFRIKSMGVISINLSVFLLTRLLPLVEHYHLEDQFYLAMLSHKQDATFGYQPYDHHKPLEDKLEYLQQCLQNKQQGESKIRTSQIRDTLFHLLTSKDDNLVYMVSHLLIKVFESTKSTTQTLIECGIYLRVDEPHTNRTRKVLIPLIIKQLGSPFRITTLKNIVNLLIKLTIIKNDFFLEEQQKGCLCEIYKKAIDKARLVLKNTEHYEYIIESFENDERIICQRILETKPDIGHEAFLPPGEESTTLPFFERLPADNKESSRYDLAIFGLLRKLRYVIIKDSKLSPQEINFQKFYQSTLTSSASDYIPGNDYEIPKCLFLPCKLANGKVPIPSYIIEDPFHFVIGVELGSKLKIVINVRYKNLAPVIDLKSKTIVIKVRGYSSKDQQWKDFNNLELKAENGIVQKIIENIIARRNLCRQSELSFISKLLTKCESDIPPVTFRKDQTKGGESEGVQEIDLLNMN